MYKSDVLNHFGGNQAAVARAIGISRVAVNEWPPIVPEASAYRLERATNGALKVNPAIYDRLRQKRRLARRNAALRRRRGKRRNRASRSTKLA